MTLDDPTMMLLMGLGTGLLQSSQSRQPLAGIGAGLNSGLQAMMMARNAKDQREMKGLQREKLEFDMDQARKQEEQDAKLLSLLGPGMFSGTGPAVPTAGGGTPGAGVSAAPTGATPDQIIAAGRPKVDYLVSNYGLSPQAAAGVVGGLGWESRFDPNATHDGGRGYGMAGWDPNRTAGLHAFAQSQGKQASDPQVQLNYVMHEMKGGDMGAQRAFAMLQQAKTPQEATTAMMHYFRPQGYTPANPQGGMHYAQRVQLANSFMPGAGVPQGDAAVQPVADPSGTPIPPPQAAGGAPAGIPRTRQTDPNFWLPFLLSKRLAPIGQAGIQIGNQQDTNQRSDRSYGLEVDRFGHQKSQDTIKNEREAAAARLAAQNAKVTPEGVPNQVLIETEAQAAAAQEEAKRKAALNYDASQKLTEAEMTRYSKETRPGVEAAVNSLPNLYEMKRLADSPIMAGPLIDTRQLGARLKDMVGLGDVPDAMLSRTEFTNRASKQVLSFLQTRALGAGSGISEGDRKFVEKMAASGGDFTQEELKRLVKISIDTAQIAIKQHGQAVDRLYKLPGVANIDRGYFDIQAPSYDDWSKANPMPAAPQMPAPPPGFRVIGQPAAPQPPPGYSVRP